MRLPSKVFSFGESVISKFPAVLTALEREPLSARILYAAVKGKTEDVGEFLEILDCLYALGKIQFDEKTRKLTYVN
jgi:hypothetical protein